MIPILCFAFGSGQGSLSLHIAMSSHLSHRPFLLSLFTSVVAGLCLLTSLAQAQFQVALTLDKVNYIDQEFITATVSVTNRSGADVILGAARGTKSWLSFDVTDSKGGELPSLALPENDVPPIFRAGDTVTRKIKLIDVYPEDELGTYSIKASAYHPPTSSFYDSNRVRFVVSDVKPFTEPLIVGVPPSYPDAGRSHAYELLIVRDMDHSYLYLRMRDVKTKRNLVTYQLAPITMARDPEYHVDGANALHILFLAGPKLYVYAVIEPDGHLKSKTILKDLENNRPQLFRTADNGVVARGGELLDPNSAKANPKKGRSLSDRPPGL